MSDSHGGSATATVSITVIANSAPVAVNDAATTPQGVAVVVSVRANDTDAEGHTLLVTAVTAPAHGTATINGGLTVSYTPVATYSGPDSFSYAVSDGHGGLATAIVTITVQGSGTPVVPIVTPTPPAGSPNGDDVKTTRQTEKDACKDGGWRTLGFRNQGQCVSAANHDAAEARRNDDDRDDDDSDDDDGDSGDSSDSGDDDSGDSSDSGSGASKNQSKQQQKKGRN